MERTSKGVQNVVGSVRWEGLGELFIDSQEGRLQGDVGEVR